MRKLLLSFLFFVFACANAWGDVEYTWDGTNYILTIHKAGSFASGVINDYTTSNQPWNSRLSTVEEIIVEDGITTIGKNAFYNASRLKIVRLPKTITTLKSDAFKGASSSISVSAKLYFAGSPNEWAKVTIASKLAHPLQATGYYYFYNDVQTTRLVLMPPLTEIKKLAFYHGTFQDIHIPGTVAYIRDSAFMCSWSTADGTRHMAINRNPAPSIGTNALPAKKTLYYPTGASGYDTPFSTWTKTPCAVGGTLAAAYGSNITWSLAENGTLTLNATSATKTISFSSYSNYPWSNFRRLVNKVILTGEITEVSETFAYCFGLNEIELQQTTIPTVTPAGDHTTTIAYSSRFDKLNNVVLKIKAASLTDASASNLASDPWNNAKLDIQLSDNVVIGDNADYTTLLTNCSTYVEAPITLQLGRSLTNTQYNTFCSPIALDNEQMEAVFGADYDLEEFVSSSLEDDVLSLEFSKVTSLEAGKPYLLQPAVDVENPVFEGVTIGAVSPADQTSDTYISFHGTFNPTSLEGGNRNLLFLGAGNELFYPSTTANIKGFRAYFEVKGAAQKNGIRARIVKKEDMATGFETVSGEGLPVTGKKILRNGQLFIIRDNKNYNAQGQLVK